MACHCGYVCTRNALAALNITYIAVALALITVAVYAKATAYISVIPATGAGFACGMFLLFTSIIGIYGTIQQHQVLLFFYALMLIVLFILQLTIGFVCVGLRSKLNDDLLRKAWEKADDDLKANTQDEFVCCGFNAGSQTVFHGVLGHPLCNTSTLASACCGQSNDALCCTGDTYNDTYDANTDGLVNECSCPSCWQKISPVVDEAIIVIGLICILFSFTELIGAWLTFKYRNIKNPHVVPSLFV